MSAQAVRPSAQSVAKKTRWWLVFAVFGVFILSVGLVRVYLKRERTVEADREEPLIIKNTATLDDVLKRISNQMRDDISKAYIWGTKAKFPGQEVSFTFPVFDEMEVYFGR
jgi:ribosome-interacting GTPase 1